MRSNHSFVFPWPTPTGAAVVAVAAIATVMARGSAVAIGFLVPLLLLMALDFGLGAVALRERPISLSVRRRVASLPEQRVGFTAGAPAAAFPLRVLGRRLVLFADDADFAQLGPDETHVEFDMPPGHAITASVMRVRAETSIIGLTWARRWSAHEIPTVAMAPGPHARVQFDTPASQDLTRLREYLPGDRQNRVSWSATARTGRLHVRDESFGDDEITVVVDLGTDVTAVVGNRLQADVLLEHAATVVDRLLERGRTVRLVTCELPVSYFEQVKQAALARPHRPPVVDVDLSMTRTVSGIVTDRTELARRLALAEHGEQVAVPAADYVLVNAKSLEPPT